MEPAAEQAEEQQLIGEPEAVAARRRPRNGLQKLGDFTMKIKARG